MNTSSIPLEDESGNSLQSLINQWETQHTSLERYFFAWYLTFGILRKFRIEPTDRKGTFLRFWMMVFLVLSPALITTAIRNEWKTSPVLIWIIIALFYSFASLTYSIYKNAGTYVCSIGHTITNKEEIKNQIHWDHKWFNIRMAFIPGIMTSLALIVAVLAKQPYIAETPIATGAYFLIAVIGYQIGESTWNFILLCVEAHKISLMEHNLYWFRPAHTVSIIQSLRGYNQLAALNSLLMTAFLGGLAWMLPEQQYPTNLILLIYLVVTYIVIGLSIFVPRLSLQRIVQASKVQELKLIQGFLNPLNNKIQSLSDKEFEELKRLDEIHEVIQNSCENFLPFSTIGRILGAFFLPTVTFILAVASETYLQMLLEKFFR